jgi:hypothetical protein
MEIHCLDKDAIRAVPAAAAREEIDDPRRQQRRDEVFGVSQQRPKERK